MNKTNQDILQGKGLKPILREGDSSYAYWTRIEVPNEDNLYCHEEFVCSNCGCRMLFKCSFCKDCGKRMENKND